MSYYGFSNYDNNCSDQIVVKEIENEGSIHKVILKKM
jgi:hypothetical protein